MKKFFTLSLLCVISLSLKAQTTPSYQDEPFGKVSTEDLQMTACDFEKDANAEVLLNIGKFYWGDDLNSILGEYHKRIKIFNANGNDAANIHIEFEGADRMEAISGIDVETINYVNGKAEITKVDKKSIFIKPLDAEYSELSFTFPNVQPGSVLEYKYKLTGFYNDYLPTWDFQENIPVRYSEINTQIPEMFYFRVAPHFSLPTAKHTTSITPGILKAISHSVSVGASTSSDQQSDTYNFNVNVEIWGIANVPALVTDGYTSSFQDNAQRVSYDLVSVRPFGSSLHDYSDTWSKVAGGLILFDRFGPQLNKSLSGEDAILDKARGLKTNDERVAFVFDTIRNAMKWNSRDHWYVSDGPSKAWGMKSGNSTEINLMVYHLLHELKIEAYPMLISTRDHGKANPYVTSPREFNRTVVYVPVDTAKYYILDATGKYNAYNDVPAEDLNSFGLWINKSKNSFDTLTIRRTQPVRQVVLINAEIKAGGKLDGTAQISSSSYDRVNAVSRYKADGEQKFCDYLSNGDHNMKISAVKFDNMQVDTLPLTQNITFGLELAGSDENYIYLNPNIFTPLKSNPFLAENRQTDIYYAFLRNYSINGVYKIPAGYAVNALPKSVSMVMPDKSIAFKRIVAEQDGSILVHFIIDVRTKGFTPEQYPAVHEFYKKMFDMLNEQIVLKKS